MNEKLFHSDEIDEWNCSLNTAENAPARGYRRNVSIYPLVCYVNNINACYLGRNLEAILAFIRRARDHMSDRTSTEEWGEYYRMVQE